MTILVRPAAAWASSGAEIVVAAARRALARSREFSLVLAGGQSPVPLYQALTTTPFRQEMPWRAAQLFWGDERCVPFGHPASNHGQCRSWLEGLELSPRQVHPMDGAAQTPSQAARDYEARLREHFRGGPPCWDLLLLGMGGDGHVASLFPLAAGLEPGGDWVTAVEPPPGVEPPLPRISLTLEALNQARHALMLVRGRAKAGMLAQVLDPGRTPDPRLPASLLRPRESLTWLLDEEAAAGLPPGVRNA